MELESWSHGEIDEQIHLYMNLYELSMIKQ